MSLALLSVLGVALDALLGEPKRWHPLVAFGRLADRLERRFNRSRVADSAEKLPFPNPGCAPRSEGRGDRLEQADTVVSAGTFNSLSLQGEGVSASTSTPKSDTPGLGWRSHGVTAWIIAVIPLTLIALLLSLLPYVGWIVQVLALYAALGLRSLGEHADPVVLALRSGDLNEARLRVGYVVSRETAELDETAVARAATESVLENGSDAVYAALFWFAVAGAPGVVLYRLSNTLDAMWGYRNARFERFGWAAAKIDDVLNYIPARLVALTYALLGHTRLALRCWRTQAPKWDSPNAGPVMAAGAGA
ncbi:adenosylcobinamide-phosphate synthase CbiB, partial [Pseudomonas nitroreducens]|uniref:adenosylcobinamide-phosphate synthase CbiB n=1 Tax=Pseudomonas nitroreducens TaxID=46680 RepID=UPI0028ABBC02